MTHYVQSGIFNSPDKDVKCISCSSDMPLFVCWLLEIKFTFLKPAFGICELGGGGEQISIKSFLKWKLIKFKVQIMSLRKIARRGQHEERRNKKDGETKRKTAKHTIQQNPGK